MVLGKYFITPLLLLTLVASAAYAGQGQGMGKGHGARHQAAEWTEALTAEQKQAMHAIMTEAQPRLRELRSQVRLKMQELHSFAYRDDEDAESLSRIGRELQGLRDELRKELLALDQRLEDEVGIPALPQRGRSCSNLATRLPSLEGGEVKSK